MLRRDLIKTSSSLAAMGAVSAISALPATVSAQQRSFKDGADFLTLEKAVNTDAKPGQIEIIEFFWYSCPHCNAFEPKLAEWIKQLPKDVVFKRVPVAFRDSFAPQQRLFYALEAMGKLEQVHKKVFFAIHVEKQKLDTQPVIMEWVVKQGLDKTKFEQAYNAFSTEAKVRRATQLTNDFKVSGVPALGVAGRYYTDGSQAGTMERALAVVDWLASETRKKR